MVKAINPSEVIPYEIQKDLFNICDFKCGRAKYDEYIKKDAFVDQKNRIGRVVVFVYKKNVVGYVTLAMSQLAKKKHQKLGKMTNYGAVPSLLLGQMARHADFKKMGVGKIMLGWVLNQAFELSKRVGCRLVILHSEKDKVEYYKSFKFVHIPPDSNQKQDMMFIDLLSFMK